MATESLVLKGVLVGHSDWVTQIATSTQRSDILLSSSRDKSIIVWQLNDASCGTPTKSLHGHSNFVSDTVMSSDGLFAVSSSWDGSLRLWDLSTGTSLRQFVGHKKDVLSVAFSPDNRQIVSGGRDKTIKLWNTVGECKHTIVDDNHTEWVSCVRFSPNQRDPLMISAGWDKLVKVWNLTDCKLRTNFYGHNSYLNTVTISPDGSLCASGGRDGQIMLWDLKDGKHLCTLTGGDTINALSFSPNRYWLCAASGSSIKTWDLETKALSDEVQSDKECTSLAWSGDGQTLFAGFTDSQIRVFEVRPR